MANHGYVKTRKVMSAVEVTQLLDALNTSLFRGVLDITHSESDGTDGAYGPHTWLLIYTARNIDWVRRVCWLESPTHFEMRHGGGSKLAWWMDTAILNEVAVRFDGVITDDGGEDKRQGVPDKYNRFSDYMALTVQHVRDPALRAEILRMEMLMIPEEWHITEKAEDEDARIIDPTGAGETDRRGA